VDALAGRSLFYTFQTSPNPFSDPLVLWLNGGPGCSSLGGGWLSELGPWQPNSRGELERNPFAWTQVANVVFLESPAGVGYSYFNASEDAQVGDQRTASDARAFLLAFLDRFPGLRAADVYIAGESYAGHYIPTLAAAILEGNDVHPGDTKEQINLAGFAIGNAWTDAAVDNLGAATHWHTHYHISTAAFEGMTKVCNFSDLGPVRAVAKARQKLLVKVKPRPTGPFAPAPAPAPGPGQSEQDDEDHACMAACDLAVAQLGPLDIYQLFSDVCPAATDGQVAALLRALSAGDHVGGAPARLLERARVVSATQALRKASAPTGANAGPDGSGFPYEDACVDDYVTAYLNRADVRKALHVTRPGEWALCTDSIEYSQHDLLSSMLPLHKRLIADGRLRILIFSGDVDGIVPTQGSRAWIEGMQLPVRSAWRPWMLKGGDHLGEQVGGYTTEYEGLTFSTVRGAGHMVPATQPSRGLHLFKNFLAGVPL